jgi:hypothetical protein
MSLRAEAGMNKISTEITAVNENKQTLKHGKLITYLISTFLSDVCTYLSGNTTIRTRQVEGTFLVIAIRTSRRTTIIWWKEVIYLYKKRCRVLFEISGLKYHGITGRK